MPPVPEAGTAEMRVTPPGWTVVVKVPVEVPSESPLHRSVMFADPVSPSWASDTLKVWLAEVSVLKMPMSQVPFCCRLSKTCSLPLSMTRSAGDAVLVHGDHRGVLQQRQVTGVEIGQVAAQQQRRAGQ